MKTKNYTSRYFEIIKVFGRNGILKKIRKIQSTKTDEGAIFSDEKLNHELGESLRLSFEQLGPTFVKLGQMLSTRADIFPNAMIEELEKLQDNVPAFESEKAIEIIEESLERPLSEIFLSFEKNPIAQGSIAQVHTGRLKSGEKVAIKIQRPDIKNLIRLDISIIESIVARIEGHIKINKIVNLRDIVDEFKSQIENEMNFEKEAKNIIRFAQENYDDKYVRAPLVYDEYTHEKVLVMEFLGGKPLKNLTDEQILRNGKELANRLIYSFSNQVFKHGYFHADPHPGNILIDGDLQINIIDFGIVGNLSDKKKYTLLKLFLGISLNSTRIIIASIIELGALSPSVNTYKLEKELQLFLDRYMKISLREIKLASLFEEFIELLLRYEIRIDKSLTMLGKTIMILEGVIENLYKESSFLELSKPIALKLFKNFISFDYVKQYFLDSSVDAIELFTTAPKAILDFSRKMEESGFKFNISHTQDQRSIDIAKKKVRQNQRHILLALSLISFLVSFIILSVVQNVGYESIWQAIAIISGVLSAILGIISFVDYIKDKD